MTAELFDEIVEAVGDVLGNGAYDVLRPDYSSSTTAIMKTWRGINMRCDYQSGPYSEPRIPMLEYYSVFCQRFIKPGDVLVPNPAKSGVPTVTLQNTDNIKEAIAFRSDRICSISTSSLDPPFYTNVNFDFAGIEHPETPLDPQFESSPPILVRRAALFYRSGIDIGRYLYDVATAKWFRIFNIGFIGNTMELFLDQNA